MDTLSCISMKYLYNGCIGSQLYVVENDSFRYRYGDLGVLISWFYEY